jgi:predicted permease
MNVLLQDLRFAIRQLARSPGFAAIGILSVAIGIGVTTLVFSVAGALVLRSYALPDGPDAVRVLGHSLTRAEADRMRDGVRPQVALAAVRASGVTLVTEAGLEQLGAEVVSDDFFAALGHKPVVGRLFGTGAGAEGGDQVCVISYRLWQRHFAGDSSVIGESLRLNDRTFEVVGVAPREFQGTAGLQTADVWLLVVPDRMAARADSRGWGLIGRLKGDTTRAQAHAALVASASDLHFVDPRTGRPARIHLQSLAQEQQMRAAVVAIFTAIAGLVLLVACANVAGLLAARAELRRPEIAIRLALGSGRLRLVRQLLTESLVLAAAGAGLGLLATLWLGDLTLTQMLPTFGVQWPEIHVDRRILALTLVLTALATLVAGLLPAMRASRADLTPVLKGEASRGSRRRRFGARHALVVGQLVVSFAFIATAGLFVRTMQRGLGADLGFSTDRMLAVSLSTGGSNARHARAVWGEALERVKALPGVTDVTLTSAGPLFPGGTQETFVSQGREAEGLVSVEASVSHVLPSYFDMTALRVVRGRIFTEQEDRLDAPIVVVSEQAALRMWPQGEALGQLVRIGDSGAMPREVIGVVRDRRTFGGEGRPEVAADRRPALYLPHGANPAASTCMLVMTKGDTGGVAAAIRRDFAAVSSRVRLGMLETARQSLRHRMVWQTVGLEFLGILGLLASLLAMVGLYGALAHIVEQRTQEIGVRMAMGAGQGATVGLVLRQGIALAGVGIVLGLPAAIAAERVARAGFPGVPATDPVILTLAALAVLVVAVVGSYLPARRAARVDPMVALRCE